MDKKTRTAIIYVEYTDANGFEQECTTTEEINDDCIDEGYKRYAQAHGLPFLTGQLLEDIGFLGNHNIVQAILDGTYDCPEEVYEFTPKIIKELRRPGMANRHATITGYTLTDEHIKSWKKMRVGTVSSTFGPSFSEIIAGTDNVAIVEIDAAIVSITALTGYCPEGGQKQ
jgi:hypothetical protein